MESPIRKDYNPLLTPPPSSVKNHDVSTDVLKEPSVKPKRLINELQKVKKVSCCAKTKTRCRRSKVKYRPELDSLFPLDAYLEGSAKNMYKDAEYLISVLTNSKKIIVVQGAGVSVAAGIPDFRSSDGLFTTLKSTSPQLKSGKDLFDFNNVYSSNSMSISFNNLMSQLYHLSSNCKPTSYHKFINNLVENKQVKRIYTQNIDGLETKFPSTAMISKNENDSIIVQLHGSIKHMSCLKCKKVYDMDPSMFKISEEAETGEIVPQCPECKEFESVRSICGKRLQGIGKLKPNVILYNEYHPEGDIISDIMNKDLKSNPDTLLIVGTSLQIPGVRQMVKQFAAKVRSKKGNVIWINCEKPSPNIKKLIKGCDLIVLGDCQNIPLLIEKGLH